MKKALKVALVGNPNCGKTSLFNDLTGSNQYVGNWPGVTVEKKVGKTTDGSFELVDLPGIYSLSPYTMEEIVTRDFIIDERPDAVINIIDGTNIERNLYLTLQLIELDVPMVVAVNMYDAVEAKGEHINCDKLSERVGVSFIPISAKTGFNIDQILEETKRVGELGIRPRQKVCYNSATMNAIHEIASVISEDAESSQLFFYSIKLLEGDVKIPHRLNLKKNQVQKIERIIQNYESHSKYGDRETMVADARYRYIEKIVSEAVEKPDLVKELTISEKIDKIVTNRFLAIPIFFIVIFLMFAITFGPIGEFLKSCVEWLFDEAITPFVSNLLVSANAPEWTHKLLIDAVIGGVGGIITFLPQIMLLFLCLSILEDSGYMARAAFIMDRIMRHFGLSGKSFIPMLMGFGCTTPAVMAARSLENEKDRKLTIMLTPFMSCGAKLTIYALFAGIFFPEYQGIVVFSMYILGMVVALLSGILLSKTVFRGISSDFVLELPQYHIPSARAIAIRTWDKGKGFLIKAGTVIFSMSVVIWFLQNFNFTLQMVDNSADSILGQIGMLIAPIFAPLGFGSWEASVSLLTGLVAKESVASTMNVLYATGSGLSTALSQAFTPLAAYAFMAFTLLYMPCISAFATIRREMNSVRWALGSALYQTAIAYLVALLIFQIGSLFV